MISFPSSAGRKASAYSRLADHSDHLGDPTWPATSVRQRAILRVLAESGIVTVAEIAQRFNISPATARRDASVLAEAGAAARSHGGLRLTNFSRGEQHFRVRCLQQMAIKMRIAAKAVDLLPPSGNIFVDAGTTCLEVGRLLLKRPHLRLFTNSVPLIALAAEARATLTGIGGEIRKMSLALTGGFTQAWLADLHFDAAVVGAAGLDPTQGAYTSEIHEAAIKTEALRRAVTRVLVADAEKWNRPTAVRFAPWNAFTFFVSNRKPYHVAGSALAAQNVRLQLTDFQP